MKYPYRRVGKGVLMRAVDLHITATRKSRNGNTQAPRRIALKTSQVTTLRNHGCQVKRRHCLLVGVPCGMLRKTCTTMQIWRLGSLSGTHHPPTNMGIGLAILILQAKPIGNPGSLDCPSMRMPPG